MFILAHVTVDFGVVRSFFFVLCVIDLVPVTRFNFWSSIFAYLIIEFLRIHRL